MGHTLRYLLTAIILSITAVHRVVLRSRIAFEQQSRVVLAAEEHMDAFELPLAPDARR